MWKIKRKIHCAAVQLQRSGVYLLKTQLLYMKAYKLYVVLMLLLSPERLLSQMLFYQNTCKCGNTVSGFSTGAGSGSGNFQIYVEPSSVVKKAWLFCQRYGKADSISIMVNGVDYNFNYSNQITSNYNIALSGLSAIHGIDVTNELTPLLTSFNVTIPAQYNTVLGNEYNVVFLWVEYENSLLNYSTISVLLNNYSSNIPNANFSVTTLNPIDTSIPVGFAVYSDRLGDTLPYNVGGDLDGSYVYVNSNLIGLIGGSDSNSSSWGGAGVKGSFYYQNNTLFGLEDDTPDNVMGASDGLADISSYLSNNQTSFNFNLKWQDSNPPDSGRYNIYQGFFLTYTTPCDTFSVKLLTEDTSVCKGQTVQLGVIGGNTGLSKPTYEWLPQKDLSCYTCANPVFSGDSSQVYTVRIWNTDSCSKVLPVRVKVVPPPVFGKITTQNTVCGAQSGAITATAMNNSVDSLFFNGSFTGLAPLTLSNLGAGTDTLYLKDTLGCVSQDTLVTINSSNNTQALFTVNPQTGAAPLHVTTNNQSTHATDYLWYFLNDSTTAFAPNISFDTSGSYTVTLLAYQNDISCADTFSLSVTVYDSLQIIVPNVITANGDGQNDVFSIQVNAPCKGTVNIVNRWGNEVYTQDFSASTKQKIQLWDGAAQGKKVDEGTYFYVFIIEDEQGATHKLQGFVRVVR